MQFLTSPGGSIPHSALILPELPPSSVTATTAVIFRVKPFKPLSKVESPVPPPTATITGPIANFFDNAPRIFIPRFLNGLKSNAVSKNNAVKIPSKKPKAQSGILFINPYRDERQPRP